MDWIILASHRNDCRRSLQTLSNRLSNGSFSDAWWTCQKKNHSFLWVNSLVFSYEFKDPLFGIFHAIVALFKDVFREGDVPKWLNFLVPRKPKDVVQVLNLSCIVHVILLLELVDFFLQNFPYTFGHLLDLVKLFLEFWFLWLLVVLEYFLVSSLKQVGFGPLLELLRHLLHIVELFVYHRVELFEINDYLSRPMDGVLDIEEILNLGSHAVVVLGKDGLEDGKVVLTHFVHDLIEGVKEVVVSGVLGDVEDWGLQCFCHHVIPVQNFLGEYHKHWVNLFVIHKPSVLELVEFGHEQVLVLGVDLVLWALICSHLVVIFLSSTKIGEFIVLPNFEPFVRIRLYYGDVIFLDNFDFYTNCVLCIGTAVALEVHPYYSLNFVFVLFVLPQELLDVLVLGEGKLSVRQDWRVELEGVHPLRWAFLAFELSFLLLFSHSLCPNFLGSVWFFRGLVSWLLAGSLLLLLGSLFFIFILFLGILDSLDLVVRLVVIDSCESPRVLKKIDGLLGAAEGYPQGWSPLNQTLGCDLWLN